MGSVPGGPIDFPFVVAGVETQGTHSCPRLFIRAGSDPTFTGPHLEIEVPYPTTGVLLPGPQPGTMTVFFDAGEPWTEEVLVNVTRADGLFEGSPPPEQWRATATISHHDATTDLEGSFVDASYCTNFALCL